MNPEELSMTVIVAHAAYDCFQHLTAKRKASFKQQCLHFCRNVVGQYGAFPSYIRVVPLVRGNTLATFAREVCAFGNPAPPPACLIFGDETTVMLGANHVGAGAIRSWFCGCVRLARPARYPVGRAGNGRYGRPYRRRGSHRRLQRHRAGLDL